MCNGCGKPPWPKLPNEKDENPPPDTCAPFSSCSELETLSQFDMTDAQRKHRWRKEGHASIWLAQLCRASGRFASCLGQRDQSPLLTRGDVSSNLSAQRGTIRGISGFLILRGDFGRPLPLLHSAGKMRKGEKESDMKRTWTSEELLEHFTLLPDELTAIGNKSGATRLGFAVLLKCLQYEGRFPRSRQEVAPEVVRFLATQVGVDATLFAQYAWEGRTIETHRAKIRELAKIREFRRADEEALLDWLVTSILAHEQHPERLGELIRAECRTRAIEAPDDIAALVEVGLAAYEAQIYTVIVARLTPEVQERLDALLVAQPVPQGEEEEALPLSLLRLDPGPVGVESALSEIAKLRSLRAIGLPPDLFAGYTPRLVERLRRRIAAESPSHIREHPQAIRMTLLAALVYQRTKARH